MAKKSKKTSSDASPADKLEAMRLRLMMQSMQPQQNPAGQPIPVTGVGTGIVAGLQQAANAIAPAIQQNRMMKQLTLMAQIQREQQAAEADKEAQAEGQRQWNLYQGLQSAGMDYNTAAYLTQAGADTSLLTNILTANQKQNASDEDLRMKMALHQRYVQDLVAAGVKPEQATVQANTAFFGERLPVGASELGTDIGGTLKTGRLSQAYNGHPEKMDKEPASPLMRTVLSNYGIAPVDAADHVKRLAESQNAAQTAQWQPIINQANVENTQASTNRTNIGAQTDATQLGIIQDQRGLGQQFGSGNITAPEYMKGSLGLSLNPISDFNTLTGNKNLYGNGKSLLPDSGSLSYPDPNATTPSVPPSGGFQLPSMQMPTFQTNPSLSPAENGAALRSQMFNQAGQGFSGLGRSYRGGMDSLMRGINSGIEGTLGFFGVPSNQIRRY